MAQLNIKVGASIDRNMAVAYRDFIAQAKRATSAVDAEMKKSARAIQVEQERSAKASAKAAERAERDKERAFARTAREAARWQKEMLRDADKAKKDELRAFEKAEKEKTKLANREAKQRLAEQRQSDRQAERISREYHDAVAKHRADVHKREEALEKRVNGAATSVGRGLLGIGKAGVSKAVGIAAGLARGHGVNFDVGSIVQKNASLETLATQISNSGYMAGDARNGRRVGIRELMNDALDAGKATGTDANEVLEGLGSFVGLTGDLQTGREALNELLVLAKATGSEFSDMASAAANVSNALPESATKGREVYAVMQAIAGQGKLGAVEIKDLASQMAKLAAGAGGFAGDRADTIRMLGVLAQEARSEGGAASASQAVNSVSSFVGTFDKAARNKAFDSFKVTTRDGAGKLLSSDTIIKNALTAASSADHGGMAMFSRNMGKMFMDKEARKVTKGFETIYSDAGGGKKGLLAVDREFERIKAADLAKTEIQESFNRAMKTGQSQAEVFNQEMRKSTLAMQDALLPAIVALAPAATGLATKFSDIATKLFGDDPRKKQLEEASSKTRGVLDSAITQVGGSKQISAETLAQMAQVEREMKATSMGAEADVGYAKKHRRGAVSNFALKAFDYTPIGALTAWAGGGSYGDGLGNAAVKTEADDIQKKEWEAQNAKRLYEEVVNSNRILRESISNGIVVVVKNIDELKTDGGPSGVDNSGRTPPPGAKPRGK